MDSKTNPLCVACKPKFKPIFSEPRIKTILTQTTKKTLVITKEILPEETEYTEKRSEIEEDIGDPEEEIINTTDPLTTVPIV